MPLSGGNINFNSSFGPNYLESIVETLDWGLPYIEQTGFAGVNHLGVGGGSPVYGGFDLAFGAPFLGGWDLGFGFFGDVGGYVGDWMGEVSSAGQALLGWGDTIWVDPFVWGPAYYAGAPTIFDSLTPPNYSVGKVGSGDEKSSDKTDVAEEAEGTEEKEGEEGEAVKAKDDEKAKEDKNKKKKKSGADTNTKQAISSGGSGAAL